MAEGKVYSDRSAAVRAARAHCKRVLGPRFCAFEGPDYAILPDGSRDLVFGPKRVRRTQPCKYQLRGPAAEERN